MSAGKKHAFHYSFRFPNRKSILFTLLKQMHIFNWKQRPWLSLVKLWIEVVQVCKKDHLFWGLWFMFEAKSRPLCDYCARRCMNTVLCEMHSEMHWTVNDQDSVLYIYWWSKRICSQLDSTPSIVDISGTWQSGCYGCREGWMKGYWWGDK